ncbi:MAG: hypothetical protein ACLQMH_07895 [Solirubrobacteraceae bacterium]
MPLGPAKRAVLETASEAAINQAARRLGGYVGDQRWLPERNRYGKNAVKRLRADEEGSGVRSRNLADYVAASAPLHCCDGWSLLGRAVGAHLRGDADAARHLAYYAELRAAMSLLATQGVGIFSDRHFVIDEHGAVRLLTKAGTHAAAWDVLETWADTRAAADVLGAILMPGGRTISDWVDALPSGSSWRPIATEWLRHMGLDLQVLSEDRDARNEASYRPNHLRARQGLSCTDAVSIARELWALLAPEPSLPFTELDRYLLRRTLEQAFYAVEESTHRQAPRRFERAITTALQTIDPGLSTPQWERFLRRVDDPDDPPIMRVSETRPAVSSALHHVSVMARALMLLRVSSGTVRHMLIEAGVGLGSLSFWWEPYGRERGLWSIPPLPSELMDGWADTELTLSEVDDWIGAGRQGTYREMWTALPSPVTDLASLEKVGLWSLAA